MMEIVITSFSRVRIQTKREIKITFELYIVLVCENCQIYYFATRYRMTETKRKTRMNIYVFIEVG